MGHAVVIRVEAEPVLDASAAVGEGPMWDVREGVLYWLDLGAGLVHRFDPSDGSDDVVSDGRLVGAIAPRARGGLVAATEDGFAALDPSDGSLSSIAAVEASDATTRMNDGRCDPAGRFWAGSMARDARPGRGTLYRLDIDGDVQPVLGAVTISNGIDWSPDGRTMYYIDTPTFRVDAFDFDPATGAASRRRALVSFPERRDPLVGPDGMCVDADGFLWVAFWGGGSVRRFAPDGTPAGEVLLPVTDVTACAFGGEDLCDLYVTTAAAGASSSERYAGALFRCRPGVRGRAPMAFGG